MFSINATKVYKKISVFNPENPASTNKGRPSATINFYSDEIEFLPFMQNKDFSKESELTANDLINFAKGEFNSIEIQRDNWTELNTRINDIISRLKTELASGLTAIGYSGKSENINTTSTDGVTWV